MVTITEGIAAATFALKAAKDLREIDRSISEADFKLKIADLTSKLADVKLAMTELGDDLRAKDTKIGELTAAIKKRADLVERYGHFYEAHEGEPFGRPFCPVCLDAGSFIRIEHHHGAGFACPKCKAAFGRVQVYSDPRNRPAS